jgi:hypothetical protein
MSFKKFVLFLVLILVTFPAGFVVAEGEPAIPLVHLTIRAGEVIYSEDVEAPKGSTVLSVLTAADEASPAFAVTDIQHYSFGDYLKCVDIENVGEKCDDWQYVMDGDYPSTSIDLTPVAGVGSVYFYFSPKNQISLSADSIDTGDTLTVTVQNYDYEEGSWEFQEGAVVGVGLPDTSGSFNPPLEIMQGTTDGNGQTMFSDIPAGSYEVGVPDEFGYYFPSKTLTVTEAPPENSGGSSHSSGGGHHHSISIDEDGEVLGAETKVSFNLPKAFEFLLAQQKDNGSFGGDIYTDWSAMALASGNYQAQTIKLIKYLDESRLENPRLTDYERRAMALMALGLNPYSTNGENYIGKIIGSFDGTQFGKADEDNDDIFALIVLMNSGYAPEEEIIGKSEDFVLGRQREDGSWDESVDMTGASIVALAQMPASDKKQNAIEKAKNFLKEAQRDRIDGSWNSSASSTAWALEGIKALGEDETDWKRSDSSPRDFFGTVQDTDGGIKNENPDNKLWETAYVLSALSPNTWSGTMQKFAKVETPILTIKQEIPAPKPTLSELKKKIEPKEITASAITADGMAKPEPEPEAETGIENTEPKPNWFRRLLVNIFGL